MSLVRGPWAVRRFGQQRRPTGQALSGAVRGSSVAVGPQTRYYQQHAGTVAVGDQTRYAREHPVGAPPTIGPAGVPPPSSPQSLFAKLPPSRYNPERLTLTEESERGLGQLESGDATKLSRDSGDYTTSLSELERNRGIGAQNHQTALSNLARAFQRLGVTQQERQNQAGVLPGGGAALQAAAKRLANEQRETGVENTRFGREQEAYDIAAAKLARELGPGGRAEQDINTELTNARSNNEFYGTHQETLAAREAAENGYSEPEPAARPGTRPVVRKRRPGQPGRSAFATARRKARL